MSALIKLRQKPQKPKRKRIKFTFDMDDGVSFASVMEALDCADPSKITVEKIYDYDSTEIRATYTREQTKIEVTHDLRDYQERKRKYNSWFLANKVLIRKEIQRRKTEALVRENAANEKARKRLIKELAKLEKEIG